MYVKFKKDTLFYDIVIVDINEPYKTGFDLFYDLKKANSNEKVILTSAYDYSEEIMRAINEGAKAFLPKPYNTDNLMFLIEKILDIT